MARTVTFLAGILTVAAASGLYALKFDTARIQAATHKLEQAIDTAENDIAILRAERAYLARPERIDALARRQGLGPVAPGQYRWSSNLPAMDDWESAAAGAPAGLKSLTEAEALAAARAILSPGAGPAPEARP